MANPNDSLGTNGAFGGRTSVNAFNDVLSAFSGRGIINGWGCLPGSGMAVTLGGNGTDRDVAIAEDASGNKTTINNITQSPVSVSLNSAPASNYRIDAIVAYVEDSPNGSGITDNPDVVNVLTVSGAASVKPMSPSDSEIRSAITADGASGSTAYYVVLASVKIPSGTTDIDATMIVQGDKVQLTTALMDGSVTANKIADDAVTAPKIDFSTLSGNYSTSEKATNYTWVNGKTIYKKTINFGSLPSSTTKAVAHGITNLGLIIDYEGIVYNTNSGLSYPLPFTSKTQVSDNIELQIDSTNIQIGTAAEFWSSFNSYITIFYTKSA